jgi:hypothetical protein
MDHHERQAFWQQQVEQHHSSGLSARQFTERHNLNYHRFMYWRKKFAKAEQGKDPAGFARVEQVASMGQLNGQGLCISLPGGIRITGIGHDNLGVLLSMLRQL